MAERIQGKLSSVRTSNSAWDIARARMLISKLLQPMLLGVYNRLAVYEVFGVPKGQIPHNVLTVAVFEDSAGLVEDEAPVLLTPVSNRIRVDGFPNWTFGLARTYRSITRLDEALSAFERGGGLGT